MADAQDEDQWLYGDEKEDGKDEEISPENTIPSTESQKQTEDPKSTDEQPNENEKSLDDSINKEKESSQEKDDEDDKQSSSSDEDDITVSIGEVKKQCDLFSSDSNVIQPTVHTSRFQPKAAPTSGLKDDDFNSAGKVNGVPVGELDMTDYEDKPWRKPGADLSDYFNYGFVEDTWLKYCEKQKQMRLNESNVGLGGLGGPMVKTTGTLSTVNDVRKYPARPIRPKTVSDVIKPEGNTIQVMTADRRTYSSKTIGGYANDNDYGNDFSNPPYFNPEAPPPNFFNNPPPPFGGNGWSAAPPLNTPPPNWSNNSSIVPTGPPPDMGVITKIHTTNFDEDSRGRRGSPEDEYKSRRNHRTRRSRSRSQSRHRRRSSRSRSYSRSRSRSPSHKHKRKKSKRDRDD